MTEIQPAAPAPGDTDVPDPAAAAEATHPHWKRDVVALPQRARPSACSARCSCSTRCSGTSTIQYQSGVDDDARGRCSASCRRRRLDLRRRLGGPAQPQVADHRRRRRDRGLDAAPRPHHARPASTRLWLIFLTLAVRSAGAGIQMPAVSALIPQIAPAHAADPRERHQRLHPVGDGAARAGRRRRDLRVIIGVRRRAPLASSRSSSSTSSPR